MDSLKIQDAFEPYYADRKSFRKSAEAVLQAQSGRPVVVAPAPKSGRSVPSQEKDVQMEH